MKYLIFIILFFLSHSITYAFSGHDIEYPQVSSVNPTSLKPGEILTLVGKNFKEIGDAACTNWANEEHTQVVETPCTYKSVIGAYKMPKPPTSGIPDFRFEILSVSLNEVKARVPANIASGDGDYLVGYNGEFAKGIGLGYGEILMGFGKYDKVTITGSNTNPNTNEVSPTAIPLLIPKNTPPASIKASQITSPSSSPKTIQLLKPENPVSRSKHEEKSIGARILFSIQGMRNFINNIFYSILGNKNSK